MSQLTELLNSNLPEAAKIRQYAQQYHVSMDEAGKVLKRAKLAYDALMDGLNRKSKTSVSDDPELQMLFLAFVECDPDMNAEMKSLFGDALPEPSKFDSEGNPLYSLEDVAAATGQSVDEVYKEATKRGYIKPEIPDYYPKFKKQFIDGEESYAMDANGAAILAIEHIREVRAGIEDNVGSAQTMVNYWLSTALRSGVSSIIVDRIKKQCQAEPGTKKDTLFRDIDRINKKVNFVSVNGLASGYGI